MFPVQEQLAQYRLVCPVTHQPLHQEGETLVTGDGRHRYSFADGIPVLLPTEPAAPAVESTPPSAMAEEYRRERPPSRVLAAVDRFVRARGDFRSPGAVAAFDAVVGTAPGDALCLSIGGGPTRVHPCLVNLNIERFANVDVVGTAYALPYADESVDRIHVEAVLEHLEHPVQAVAEMFRVLRSSGDIFAATPFLQGFHAYPDHFQNLTRVGHDRLFARAGFKVVDSGPCVGPTFALTDLASLYLRHYLPGRVLSRGAERFALLLGLLVRPLDRRLHRRPEAAELLASSVYARLRKP